VREDRGVEYKLLGALLYVREVVGGGVGGLGLRSRGESWRMLLIFPFLPLEIRAFEHQDATFSTILAGSVY
jgi:hypothetical protein